MKLALLHRLRMFESKVLRKIFGPTRKEVQRSWRKLHNGELHAFHSSPNIITELEGGACDTCCRESK